MCKTPLRIWQGVLDMKSKHKELKIFAVLFHVGPAHVPDNMLSIRTGLSPFPSMPGLHELTCACGVFILPIWSLSCAFQSHIHIRQGDS